MALHIAGAVLLPVIIRVPIEVHHGLALPVRFVEVDRSQVDHPSNHSLQLEPPNADIAKKRRSSGRPTEQSRISPHAPMPAAAGSSVDLTLTPPAQGPSYIQGGGSLTGGLDMGKPKSRIPGAGSIPGAPRFQMIDPKTQGIGVGLVRAVGGITGAENPRCLDLDIWQGMTPEQRIENHISEEDIEKIQRENNCGAQWRSKHGRGAY